MAKINDQPDDYRYDLTNCSCDTECTGLMHAPPQSEEELAAYNEIFHFGLPEADKPNDDCDK